MAKSLRNLVLIVFLASSSGFGMNPEAGADEKNNHYPLCRLGL